MAEKYDYETIRESLMLMRYRVRDVASDNVVCHTYEEANAKLVVRALNLLNVDYMPYMRGVFTAERDAETRKTLSDEEADALDGRGGPGNGGPPAGFP